MYSIEWLKTIHVTTDEGESSELDEGLRERLRQTRKMKDIRMMRTIEEAT